MTNFMITNPLRSDRVLIRNLQLNVLIGVYDFERDAPQRVIFEVDLHTDCHIAGRSDDVSDAVDYGKVTQLITDICDKSAYQLLEALGENVAQRILHDYPSVAQIDITLHKPDIMPNSVNVAIAISRLRS